MTTTVHPSESNPRFYWGLHRMLSMWNEDASEERIDLYTRFVIDRIAGAVAVAAAQNNISAAQIESSADEIVDSIITDLKALMFKEAPAAKPRTKLTTARRR